MRQMKGSFRLSFYTIDNKNIDTLTCIMETIVDMWPHFRHGDLIYINNKDKGQRAALSLGEDAYYVIKYWYNLNEEFSDDTPISFHMSVLVEHVVIKDIDDIIKK